MSIFLNKIMFIKGIRFYIILLFYCVWLIVILHLRSFLKKK